MTQAWKINARGDIVGLYVDESGYHGFVWTKGVFTLIDFPGAFGTLAFGINSRGDIVGSYCDALPCGIALNPHHGFLLSGGKFVSFDFPGARFTRAFAINPRGDIAGAYLDFDLRRHAFLILRDGDEAGDHDKD